MFHAVIIDICYISRFIASYFRKDFLIDNCNFLEIILNMHHAQSVNVRKYCCNEILRFFFPKLLVWSRDLLIVILTQQPNYRFGANQQQETTSHLNLP